jgi:hypothetical protein
VVESFFFWLHRHGEYSWLQQSHHSDSAPGPLLGLIPPRTTLLLLPAGRGHQDRAGHYTLLTDSRQTSSQDTAAVNVLPTDYSDAWLVTVLPAALIPVQSCSPR